MVDSEDYNFGIVYEEDIKKHVLEISRGGRHDFYHFDSTYDVCVLSHLLRLYLNDMGAI